MRRARLALALAFLACALTPASALARPAQQFYGTQPLGTPPASLASKIAAGGVGSVRLPISWHDVQPTPGGPMNWSDTDAFVERMSSVRIEVTADLFESPDAFGGRKALPRGGPALAGWRAFVSAAVHRYGPGGSFWGEHRPGSSRPLAENPIRIWEIWNEPNTNFFTSPPRPRPYAVVLKASHQEIKAGDPGASVVIGGLLASPGKGKTFAGAMAAQGFLKGLYRVKRIKSAFEGVGVHAYVTTARRLFPLFNQIRAVMKQYKDRKTSTFLTELGWGSDMAGVFGKGPEGQASELSAAFRLLTRKSAAWKLQRVDWFSLSDNGPGLCNFCAFNGLFTTDFQPKPSWLAFAAAAGGTP